MTRGIYRLEGILGEFRDFVLATQLHTVQSDINGILSNVTKETFPKHTEIDLVLNLAPGHGAGFGRRSEIKNAPLAS